MESQNPYQTPPPVEEEIEPQLQLPRESAIGLDFESDWSTEGIKLRRQNPMHAPADLGLALLTILWLALLVLSIASQRAGGLVCLLTPIWLLAGGLWLNNLGFRSARTFAASCRGLCGRVRGRVEDGFVTIEGPEICLATRVDDCGQSNWSTGGGAVFRPPMITELLPVPESDIRETWETKIELGQKVDHRRLLDRLPGISEQDNHSDQIFAGGDLRGRDLRGQAAWRRWLVGGITLTLLGLIGLAWGVYKWMNLPPWIIDPPSHYVPGIADGKTLWSMILVFVVSAILLLTGIYLWSRTGARWAIT